MPVKVRIMPSTETAIKVRIMRPKWREYLQY